MLTMFIPFGFLLPFIWKQSARFANAAGAVPGFMVYKLLKKKFRKFEYTDACEQISCCKREPMVFIATIFIGRFLLFNEMGLARLIYGF